MGMDFPTGPTPDNYDEVRGRTLSTNKSISRDTSMSSTKLSVIYHERMTLNNSKDNDVPMDASPELSYETEQEKAFCISKVVDQQDHMRTKDGNIEATVAHGTHDESVINIQLPYDPQAPTEPNLWSSSFHPISLHGSIKHFTSDSKNIKDSLNFMARYITNKQVNNVMANDLKDFEGMGDAIWKFISSVYEAKWDSLYTDNKSTTLRAKISSKFTPRVVLNLSKNNKEITKPIPITIEKVPPPPPLPAKSKKEINVISKYFQSNKPMMDPKKLTKSYAQVSKQTANTSEVLKIKELFPALNAKQINQVNNIVKGNPKPKPRIQMTTKGPSRKQIIVPISSDNNNSVMKNSVAHVANINKLLRNTKSEVSVDYICSDPIGISIVTNKVALQLDLQIIDQYMKSSEDVNGLQVNKPRLSQSKSYLKIIGILYCPNGKSQDCLNSSNVKVILKQNQIFDNIKLVSKLRVIKVSSKSDMSII